MKQKLIDHFGDSIIISEEHGKGDIVVLRKSIDSILKNHYQSQYSDDEYRMWKRCALLKQPLIWFKVILITSNEIRNKAFIPRPRTYRLRIVWNIYLTHWDCYVRNYLQETYWQYLTLLCWNCVHWVVHHARLQTFNILLTHFIICASDLHIARSKSLSET